MKISIVVPVYNAEATLQNTINSVLNQTNSNWELILVNDGSTDMSRAICDSFSKEYDNIFTFHKNNEGQFLTRMYGIYKSSGDYIGFLDADDLLDEKYVECLLCSIETYNNPDVLCFGFVEKNGIYCKERIPDKTKQFIDDPIKLLTEILNKRIPGSMCSKVFSLRILKETYIDSEYVKNKRYGEDAFQAFLYLLSCHSVVVLNFSLYCYVRNDHGFSLGFESRDMDYFNTKYVYKMLLNKALELNSSDELVLKIYAKNFNECVNYILKYYRSATNHKRRKDLVDYDWSSYLLEKNNEDITLNPYVRKSYIKVWNAFRKNRLFEIFIREKIIGWG